LAGAAGAGLDVLDAVVRDQRAVVADGRAQDFDAVIVGALDRLRVTSKPRASNDTIAVVADLVMMLPLMSPNLLKPDTVAAAAGDLAIGDADVVATEAMHETAPGRQGMPPPSR